MCLFYGFLNSYTDDLKNGCDRLIGLTRGASKLPTYRRKYRQVIKNLIIYCMARDGTTRSMSMRSVASV